jgi:hypothetical protein
MHTDNALRHRDSSSDEMVDIQIEESLVRETFMVIDSSNLKSYVLAITASSVILRSLPGQMLGIGRLRHGE